MKNGNSTQAGAEKNPCLPFFDKTAGRVAGMGWSALHACSPKHPARHATVAETGLVGAARLLAHASRTNIPLQSFASGKTLSMQNFLVLSHYEYT
ncbi:MAG: hypothetical protein ACR2PY_05890 [Salinispira sp.]